MYTYDYDKTALEKLSEGAKAKHASIVVDLQVIADKYDIACIYDAIADDLRAVLEYADSGLLCAGLGAYYEAMAVVGSPLGEVFTSILLKGDRWFMSSSEYRQLIQLNPVFGADMALALGRDTSNIHCVHCRLDFIVRLDELQRKNTYFAHCTYCKDMNTIPRSS